MVLFIIATGRLDMKERIEAAVAKKLVDVDTDGQAAPLKGNKDVWAEAGFKNFCCKKIGILLYFFWGEIEPITHRLREIRVLKKVSLEKA